MHIAGIIGVIFTPCLKFVCRAAGQCLQCLFGLRGLLGAGRLGIQHPKKSVDDQLLKSHFLSLGTCDITRYNFPTTQFPPRLFCPRGFLAETDCEVSGLHLLGCRLGTVGRRHSNQIATFVFTTFAAAGTQEHRTRSSNLETVFSPA